MNRLVVLLLFLLGLAVLPRAQEETDFERVALRVTDVRPGSEVVIDRGTSDGLAAGDRVVFRPRAGGVYAGTVIRLGDRSAVVELQDLGLVLPRGTRGEVLVPRRRFLTDPGGGEEAPDVLEHPPWERKDERWTPDMPLLAKVDAVHPAARPMQVTGRAYVIGNWTVTSDKNRGDSFQRAGTDFVWENAFGRGGAMHLDAEYNRRTTELPDRSDEDSMQVRVDRLSYLRGGTRFAAQRHEFGRFLQRGMPEFGVVDGYEWGVRRRGGHRFGASAGFVPEPDADYESDEDFQVSAYYQWVADPTERVTAAGGFQRTFHDGNPDRDLFVGRFHYLPVDGWSLHGATWIDRYTSDDVAKGSGFELTRALASARRQTANGNGVEVTYSRLRLPELEREELLGPDAPRLAAARADRLATRWWRWLAGDKRLHTQLGGWVDEDDRGADGEVGLDVPDLLGDRSRTDVTLFGGRAEFENFYGARLTWGAPVDDGWWNVVYELANHDFAGFAPDNDDLPQHRLRVSRDFQTRGGWSVALHVDGVVGDDEYALTAGFYLQRSYRR